MQRGFDAVGRLLAPLSSRGTDRKSDSPAGARIFDWIGIFVRLITAGGERTYGASSRTERVSR